MLEPMGRELQREHRGRPRYGVVTGQVAQRAGPEVNAHPRLVHKAARPVALTHVVKLCLIRVKRFV